MSTNVEETFVAEDQPKLSKKELNKLNRQLKKAEKKLETAGLPGSNNVEVSEKTDDKDVSANSYGGYGVIQSTQTNPHINFTKISNIHADLHDNNIWIRGRVHTSRSKGKNCFLVVRQQIYTVQAVLFAGAEISKEFVKFAGDISKVNFFFL